jgi:hypothetical protein
MVERLFLDGIDLQRGRRSVSETEELPSLIYADEAEAGLPFTDVAVARAEVAVYAAFGDGFPPAAFVQSFRLLEYFQFLHGDSKKGKRISDFTLSSQLYTRP